jgi:hypothetical protein
MLLLFIISVLGMAETRKLRAFVACAFHGREWATAELCRYWERLRNGSEVEWSIVTEVNEWGVRDARTKHPCSRRNSNGVDLNRNYPPLANCTRPWRSTSGPSDEDFGGLSPLSERETKRLIQQMERFAPIDVAFFVHTGAYAILSPYDACWLPPLDPLYSRQQRLAHELVKELMGSARIRIGPGLASLYPAVGTASDYAHSVLKVPFTYTLETYEVPRHCGGADLLRKNTSAMTPHECELSFVPRYDADCREDISEYIRRWSSVFETLERIASNARERNVLNKWLDL